MVTHGQLFLEEYFLVSTIVLPRPSNGHAPKWLYVRELIEMNEHLQMSCGISFCRKINLTEPWMIQSMACVLQ